MTEPLILLWLGDVSTGMGMLLGSSGFTLTFVTLMFTVIRKELAGDWPPKYIIVLLVAAGFSLMLIATIIPSKQWFYIAAGGITAAHIADSEIGRKVIRLAEQRIDEALSEVKK